MRREERVLREQEEQEEKEEEQEEEQEVMEDMEDMETGVKLHLWEAVCCHYSSDLVDFFAITNLSKFSSIWLLHLFSLSLFLMLTNLLWCAVQNAEVQCSAV